MRELRVTALVWEAEGVLSVALSDPAGGTLPSWTPGAHIDVELAPGLRRSYSLCGDPADDRTLTIAVLHEPDGRGGSDHVHTRLRPGALIPVSPPRNNFALDASRGPGEGAASGYLFVAGGIGITPLLPMIEAVERRGVPWQLLYGGRRRASMAFLERLLPHGGRVLVRPQDEYGLLDLDAALASSTPGTVVYCCGPEPLLAAAEESCARHGRPLRLERFAAKPRADAAGGSDEPASGAGDSFEVECRASGARVTVGPGQSVLGVLRDAGLPVAYSCEDGICGTCETAVLDGDIDHRDSLLTEAEREAGDTMLLCVSRCRSARLVLDL